MKAQGPGAPTAQLDPVGDVERREVAVDPPVLREGPAIPVQPRYPGATRPAGTPAVPRRRGPRTGGGAHRRALPSIRRTTLLPCPNSSGRRGFGSVLSVPPVPRLPRALRGNGTRAGSARRKQQPPRTPERRDGLLSAAVSQAGGVIG